MIKQFLLTVYMWADGHFYLEWVGDWVHWVFTMPA